MFHYILAFLLINTYYQSLGIPIQPNAPNHLLSTSFATLAGQCENTFLSNQLKSKMPYCAVFVPPYSKKQFQCLIFYDINMQLCSAVASSKLALNEDYLVKINEKQDVNTVCTQAKEWVFTNISDFANYKESAETFFKLPATCGDVCSVEETLNEANYFCKYYKWGLEMLKSQVSTMASNANNNAVAAPVISEPDVNAKADIPIPINSNPINPQDVNTKTLNGQIKQTEPAVSKTTPHKSQDAIADNAVKSDVSQSGQAVSKQTPSLDVPENPEKNEDSDVNVRLEDPSVLLPESVVPSNDQGNKSTIANEPQPAAANDPVVPETGKDLPVNPDEKEAVIENPKTKSIGEADDYADSDGNDNVGDDEGEDPGLDIKPDQDANQNTFVRNKFVVPAHDHDVDISQKEYFPNTIPDGFSEDNDHFFPFFMTSIVLMVLLYVLYHNKSKVSKVFFGLILEGRQGGRRRNSRGHAYRRLDTLEQAMSTTTAAPPSKIIY